ncbi:MAG: DUF5685 family protein [Bacillota bacterium]|jgi:hypothetical protein
MFGYIKVHKDELKIKEYYLFRAYYCGLCRALKKRYGHFGRLVLNFDTTFLALFLSSWHRTEEHLIKERCLAHPLRKRLMIADNPFVNYAADINILLAYHSLKDNWNDDRSPVSWVGMKMLKRAYKKAAHLHPDTAELISAKTNELSFLEKAKSANIDQTADTFAKILENLCPGEGCPKREISAVKWLGYNLGKWIYLIDAYDDLAEDIKKKKYNPYLYAYGYQGEESDIFQKSIKPKVEFLLTYTLSQISRSFELLDVSNNKGILENIIYLGMMKQTESVLNQRSCKRNEKLLRNTWCQGECNQRRNP